MELCGESLLQAVKAYAEEDYSTCVKILKPVRYKIIKIGGSDAQVKLTQKWQCWHFEEIFVIYCMGSCQGDNLFSVQLLMQMLFP